jgi:hypothetical protein
MVIKQGDSLVTRARNVLTADFLASDCTHLLFIDADLVFTPSDVARISSHDADVVGGFYPLKRQGPVQWCGNGRPDVSGGEPSPGLQEVRFIGTGFMCIARRVFERMLEADGEAIRYTSDDPGHRIEHDFWRVGVRPTSDPRPRYLSEDWYFCQRWLDLGGQVYADRQVVLHHLGAATFPLDSQWEALQRSGAVEQEILYPEGEDRLAAAAGPLHPPQPRSEEVLRPDFQVVGGGGEAA